MTNPIYTVILVFLVSLAVAWIVYKPLLCYAKRKNILDNPDERKLQRHPVPLLGGLVVFIGIVVSVQLGWLVMDLREILPVEIAMLIMLTIGTLDDLHGLSPRLRMIVEVITIVLMMLLNGYSINDLHGLWGIGEFSNWVAWPLTVFAAVGIINAINMIDGVDGLSSGLCITAAGFYGLELFYLHDYMRAMLALAVVGALIPFFVHNVFSKQSKMFIGDGGTMMMGVLLSDFVINILHHDPMHDMQLDNFGAVAFTVAVLAIPVGDTLRVMFGRIIRKKSPFMPDKTHLHHAFIDYGFHHLETSLIIILLNSGIVGLWWLMYKSHFPQQFQLYIVVIAGFAVVIGIYKMLLVHKERSQQNSGHAVVDDCEIITLQNRIDERGGLVIAESGKEIPYTIKRVFYSFNIPDRKSRGAHAHKVCSQVIIAPTGCFKVELDDGRNKKVVVMDDPLKALHVHPGIWASEFDFEPSAICLVLASDNYDESDYIRDYDEFLKYSL